ACVSGFFPFSAQSSDCDRNYQEFPMNSLAEIFEAEGQVAVVGGNNPFLLEGPENVWLLLSGSVEVFAAKCQAGQIVGRKQHFFSATQGQCLFGMNLQEYGLGQGFQA